MYVSAWSERERLRNKRGWTSMSHRFFPVMSWSCWGLDVGLLLVCLFDCPGLCIPGRWIEKKTSATEAFEIHQKKSWPGTMGKNESSVTKKPLCLWRIWWIILIKTYGPQLVEHTSLRASPGLYLGCHRTLGRYFWSEAEGKGLRSKASG